MCETWDLMAVGSGYLWRSVWILWINSSVSSRSTSSSASVSELSRLVTHTAVPSPQCNSEKGPLSLNDIHWYCGVLKIHIITKIKNKNKHRQGAICREGWGGIL